LAQAYLPGEGCLSVLGEGYLLVLVLVCLVDDLTVSDEVCSLAPVLVYRGDEECLAELAYFEAQVLVYSTNHLFRNRVGHSLQFF
jgi:hypothetical protein